MPIRRAPALLVAAALAPSLGCADRTLSEVTPEQRRVEVKRIPITLNRAVDILFVVDDSPSMADKQQNLAANFRRFIEVLEGIDGGLPDIHLGVVTSDMGSTGEDGAPGPTLGSAIGGCAGRGDGGALQTFGAPITGSFLRDVQRPDGSRERNYAGELATVFGQMATGAGASGCGFEQHLAAMRAALDDHPANAGFLRDDAYLAVIVIADEDDCSFTTSALLGPESAALGPLQSFRCTRFGVTCAVGGATPDAMNQVGGKAQCAPNDASPYLARVQAYADFLRGLKDDPGKVFVAGIMGDAAPVAVELRTPPGGSTPQPALAHACGYTGATGAREVADPPVRLQAFLDRFPDRSTFTTICQPDLSTGLAQIAAQLAASLPTPCIEGTLADVDPRTPGPQYDCAVSDVTRAGEADERETVIPACAAGGALPCWRIDHDPALCAAYPTQQVLVVDRAEAPPPNTRLVAYCVTEGT